MLVYIFYVAKTSLAKQSIVYYSSKLWYYWNLIDYGKIYDTIQKTMGKKSIIKIHETLIYVKYHDTKPETIILWFTMANTLPLYLNV